MAALASEANERFENIGARRLTTIIEQVFEDVAFDASERVGGAIACSARSGLREQVARCSRTRTSVDSCSVREETAPMSTSPSRTAFVTGGARHRRAFGGTSRRGASTSS